uniref:EF-hand domain-containing protein n=1 Tax=Macrostomum lignano TaxID=282301 RepID=A0A1I8F721_9PLAT
SAIADSDTTDLPCQAACFQRTRFDQSTVADALMRPARAAHPTGPAGALRVEREGSLSADYAGASARQFQTSSSDISGLMQLTPLVDEARSLLKRLCVLPAASATRTATEGQSCAPSKPANADSRVTKGKSHGFRDAYRFAGEPVLPGYRQIGNAVACLRWPGRCGVQLVRALAAGGFRIRLLASAASTRCFDTLSLLLLCASFGFTTFDEASRSRSCPSSRSSSRAAEAQPRQLHLRPAAAASWTRTWARSSRRRLQLSDAGSEMPQPSGQSQPTAKPEPSVSISQRECHRRHVERSVGTRLLRPALPVPSAGSQTCTRLEKSESTDSDVSETSFSFIAASPQQQKRNPPPPASSDTAASTAASVQSFSWRRRTPAAASSAEPPLTCAKSAASWLLLEGNSTPAWSSRVLPSRHQSPQRSLRYVDEDHDSRINFREFLAIFRKARAGQLDYSGELMAWLRLLR